jgi:hypothetical protein
MYFPEADSRPRTLWRAMCWSVEPLLSNAPEPGRVPRGMLLEFQKKVAVGLVGWGVTLREYSRSETTAERLSVLRTALAENGIYLARSSYPESDPQHQAKTEATKLFGRCLMAGAFFLDIAQATLGVAPDHLEAMPFINTGVRLSVNIDEALAKRLAAEIEAATDTLSGFRLAPLVALQTAVIARPASSMLAVIPAAVAADLRGAAGTQYAHLVEYVLRTLDDIADDTVRRAIALNTDLRSGRLEAATHIMTKAAQLKREISNITQTIRLEPNDPVSARVASARNRVAKALACNATQACAAKLAETANAPGWTSELSNSLRPVAILLRSSVAVAREPSDREAAAAAMSSCRAAVRAAATGLRAGSLNDILELLEPPQAATA